MSEVKSSCVAKITRLVGLKGAVFLKILTDLPDRIYKSKEFFIDKECKNRLEVEKVEGDLYHLRVYFKNYDSPEKSRDLIGNYLYLPRIDSKNLNANELFFYEILEYTIEYLPDKFTKASDIYISGNFIYISIVLDKKEYLVPFNSNFIEKIDKEKAKIVLKRFENIEPNKL